MKVLALFAHIEDHICFGWPLMQNKKIEKHLIVCTNDGQSTLQKSCEDADIHLVETLGFPNGFYRKTLVVDGFDSAMAIMRICKALTEAIREIEPDFLFTHNPWGEYGHFDHRIVFEAAYNHAIPILITDIIADSVCFPRPEQGIYQALYTKPYATVESDYGFYSEQAIIFRKSGWWTHNKYLDKPYYPPKTIKLYKVNDEK